MTDLTRTDQIAADLVHGCYSLQGALSVVIRQHGDEMRVIGPADQYEALALMLYRAADELAGHAARAKQRH